MINVNYYVTMDDFGTEKYVITIDGPEAELQAMTAEEIGQEVLDTITAPPVPLGGA